MAKSFSDIGFLVLRRAINRHLIKDIQSEVYNFLNNSDNKTINHKKTYINFCKKVKNLKTKSKNNSEFEFVKPIFEMLLYKGCIKKIVLENKIYNTLTSLLGKDLAYCADPSLNLNIPKKDSSLKNYLFKNWHQEIWSGASVSSVQLWTPLFQKNVKQGQIELIIDSHKWGHVPHRNRAPIELPKNFKTQRLNLEYGDVIIFSTLVLHRSVSAEFPRLALPLTIKNFKYKNNSFQDNMNNWKIFSFSELTKIEQILGNHDLSPFRLTDIDFKFQVK